MLRQLKFDFYKITRSKVITWQWLLTGLILILDPLLIYVISENQVSVVERLITTTQLTLPLVVFSVLFISRDISSGYIKNIYTFSNKLKYVLSKVVWILVFCVLGQVLEFLFHWVMNAISGINMLYDVSQPFPLQEFVLMETMNMLHGVAIGVFCIFLCLLLKKDYIVLIILFSYLFVIGGMVYGLIENLFNYSVQIYPYTIFGYNMHYSTIKYTEEGIFAGVVLPICYIVVFGFFSWLILKKRDVV